MVNVIATLLNALYINQASLNADSLVPGYTNVVQLSRAGSRIYKRSTIIATTEWKICSYHQEKSFVCRSPDIGDSISALHPAGNIRPY